ncbi:glycosyl hydrolase family 28 protein [Proteiniphilum sp. UBA5384]|uniref:glycosyl hydrolase family 28 protein n=1 Tax=Proteiniphilum sp. UBA5384 TaxID=1947279 RepID=UPI0025F5C9A9|nr:glycosyl hydrolase family 28 protein [Proteiniphilum sp. UBA5384]
MAFLWGMVVISISCKGSVWSTDLREVGLYDSYAPIEKSSQYQVFINEKPVQVWRETCHDMEAPNEETHIHTALFDYSVGAQIKIVSSTAFTDFVLSPKRFNIATVKKGNELTFVIPEYYNYTLVIPGQEPLMLFGAPDLSSYKTENAVVFEKGVHTAPDGLFKLESNTTYYLEEGAILNGKVLIQNAQNVKIIGRGYIDDRTKPSRGNFLRVYNSENIELKGFGIRHATQGWQVDMVNSKEIQVSYLNLLSFGLNNDGLDLGTGCSQVHFEHCFIGAGDDGFGWHATNAAEDGEEPLTDCTARDCIIWKGKVGHGIRIGSSLETSAVKNLHFKDIDIVRIADGRAIVIPHSDWAEVKDIVFEGVRDEKPDQGGFVAAYIGQTQFSNPAGYRPGSISDIQFINCVSNGTNIRLEGYDEKHKIKNIIFKNVKLAGRPMQQSDIKMNEYVENVVVLND